MLPGKGFWESLMIFGIGDGGIWRVAVGEAGRGFGDGSVGIVPVLKNSR